RCTRMRTFSLSPFICACLRSPFPPVCFVSSRLRVQRRISLSRGCGAQYGGEALAVGGETGLPAEVALELAVAAAERGGLQVHGEAAEGEASGKGREVIRPRTAHSPGEIGVQIAPADRLVIHHEERL